MEVLVAHKVDTHVGKQIRHRRWMLGMTQMELAEQVGIKFQQIQKYETGKNRVSASRLWDIAAALKVGIPFFFEGLGSTANAQTHEPMQSQEAVDLVRAYYAIPESQRRRLFDLAKVLAENA